MPPGLARRPGPCFRNIPRRLSPAASRKQVIKAFPSPCGCAERVVHCVEANGRHQLGNLLKLPRLRESGYFTGQRKIIYVGHVGRRRNHAIGISLRASGLIRVSLGDWRPIPTGFVSSIVNEGESSSYLRRQKMFSRSGATRFTFLDAARTTTKKYSDFFQNGP